MVDRQKQDKTTDWQNAWTAAVQLFDHLAHGGHPVPVAPLVRLAPGELCYAGLPLMYSRYYATDVQYVRRSGLFIGHPLFMAAGFATMAIGNAVGRSRAQRAAAPQWRGFFPCHTVLTSRRTLCAVDGCWLDFEHGAIVQYAFDAPRATCFLAFSGAEPLCLHGPGAAWYAVMLAYLLYGPAFVGLPVMQPFRQSPGPRMLTHSVQCGFSATTPK
jgi:hypothetical protein